MIVIHVLICVAAYLLTWQHLFYRACFLPRSAYESGSTVLGMLAHTPTAVMLLVGILPLFIFRKRITWTEVDDSLKMRTFVWIVAAVMGVTFVLSDYNYYYDQAFLMDRIVLLALLIAVWFHPGFLFPFVLVMMTFALQIHYPLPEGMWNWPDKRMPTHMLFAFVWFVYLRIFVKTDPRLPLVLALFMAGAGYAHAGFSKVAIGPEVTTWLLENPTANIFVSAYQQGRWLGHLDEAQVISMAGVLERVGVLNNAFTLFAEIGAGLVLLDKRVARFFLAACILLHLGILSTTGIFFWKWIIVDLSMIVFAGTLWQWNLPDPAVTKRAIAMLTASTMILGAAHTKVTGILFAWWDTRHSQFFSYEVETESGKTYELDPRYFVPYDIVFVQSRFYYAAPKRILPGTFGVSHRYPVFRALQDATVDDLPAVTEEYGQWLFSESIRYDYGRFIQRYVRAVMRGDDKEFLPTWFSVPYHFQTTFPPNHYTGQSKATTVRVFFEEHFYDGDKIHNLSRSEVMVIPIVEDPVPVPSGAPMPAPSPTPVPAAP
ncbi:MAG: hypothetical protein AAF436_03140 [Myxococcota bacterium]